MFYWGRGDADGTIQSVSDMQVNYLYVYWRRGDADGSIQLVSEHVSKLSICFIGDVGMQTDPFNWSQNM